jgi:para-aminobenzoate synthetase / 4-amino-4-deoxychorismate lyase
VPDFLWPDHEIGVFETILVVGGAPIEFEAHLQRLSESLRELYRADVPGDARDLVIERAGSLALGRLRLTVAPGPGGELSAEVVTAEVDPENVFPAWQRATALRPFVVLGGLGAHKWADRDGIAWTEATEPDGYLPLVLDTGEEVLEASRANVFAVDGEALLTPPADGRILPGVARARAIAIARSLGIEVREQPLSVERLIGGGEAFLTGSVRGVEPVRRIAAAELREPGEIVARLAAEMRRAWVGEAALGGVGAQ